MKILKIAVFIAMTASVYACKKSESTSPTPGPKGTITIHSPQAASKYVFGDTVHIHATISGEQQLHGYEAYIIDTNGDTIWSQSDHAHENQLEVRQEWINTLTGAAGLKLVIKSDMDHHGNTIEQTQEFYIH